MLSNLDPSQQQRNNERMYRALVRGAHIAMLGMNELLSDKDLRVIFLTYKRLSQHGVKLGWMPQDLYDECFIEKDTHANDSARSD